MQNQIAVSVDEKEYYAKIYTLSLIDQRLNWKKVDGWKMMSAILQVSDCPSEQLYNIAVLLPNVI